MVSKLPNSSTQARNTQNGENRQGRKGYLPPSKMAPHNRLHSRRRIVLQQLLVSLSRAHTCQGVSLWWLLRRLGYSGVKITRRIPARYICR